jgi:cytochrome c oxidase assembly protein subunit 15
MTNQTQSTPLNTRKLIALWLLLCCTIIFGMVVLGGVTRLTGSGLSMVRWEPLVGTIPPLTQADWEQVFHQYQQSPEYQLKNFRMGLEDFKTIFWFEYAHRLLGRLIGLFFLLPLIYFSFKGMIEKPLIPKLGIMFILGGLQGLLGWYMVKSGLIDQPHVSQYRLTAHLGLAFIIYGYLLWVALDLLFPTANIAVSKGNTRGLTSFSFMITALVFITALAGGLVAGLKAGFVYNTFPLMGGHWIPEEILGLSPLWRNFFEDVPTVQFDHRLLATLLFILIPLFWWKAKKVDLPVHTRLALHGLLVMVVIQVTLGISTLLLYVPVSLAASHQAGALALLTVALLVNHQY